MLNLDMIRDAQEVLKGVTRVTPLYPANKLNDNLYLKAENLQMTGAFKLRGAYYTVSSLTDEERARGVIACSAGNHAQGVAVAATHFGCKSVICMPAGAPISKVEATRKYGAEVVLVPGVYDDAQAKAEELTKSEGYTFIHPFDDERVMAGQGTIGLEILEQLPDVEQVIVPIGGGGLISGVACAIKSLKPECKVIGVQAATCPSMYKSVQNGRIEALDQASTIADGILVKRPGDHTFEYVNQYVDKIVTVSEDEIAMAILTLIETQKMVSEGAGATTVAAFMFHKVDNNKKTVALVSGGNIDVTRISRIITTGLVKSGRIAQIAVKIPDRVGEMSSLLQVIAKFGGNILSIEHNRENAENDVETCVVELTLETRNREHVKELEGGLEAAGYQVL